MRRKYLFFDIDGTLAAGGYGKTYIPGSTRLALKKLAEAGHLLAISTGRSQYRAAGFMKELGFHHMVSDGGYGVTIDDELLGITPLDKDKVVALVDECIEKGFIWAIQPDNSGVRLAPDERFYDFTHDTYLETRAVAGLDPRDYPQIYKMYIACDPPRELELEALKQLPWCRFHSSYLFVEPTDKAFGIKKIVDHFGGRYEDVVVFGDALNDMSMFLPEWTSVAMGNGAEALKEKADFVTRNVDDDGIYYACESLGLFEKADEI